MDTNGEDNNIRRSRVISERDLAYWMGSVDNQLQTLREMIQRLLTADRENWQELRLWRADVESRLARGNERFVSYETRISENTKDIAEIKQAIKEKHAPEEAEKFISWPWVRDKIIAPVLVWGIIVFIGYVVYTAIPIR